MDEAMEDLHHGPRSLPPIDADSISLARPVEWQASLSIADAEEIYSEDLGGEGASAGFNPGGGIFPVCSEATSGWIRRVRIGKAPVERETSATRKCALEPSAMAMLLTLLLEPRSTL